MEKHIKDLRPHKLNEKLYGCEELPGSFVESVRAKGILVPLAVKPDGTIISGHRRWQAAKSLGMATVPVQVVEYKSDLDEREAIIDFNRQREKTFSQQMAEGEELEVIESERAKERQIVQLKRGDKSPVKETFPEREQGQTRDKVAAKIGIGSGKQYEKAKKVWQEAKEGNEEAIKLVDSIDKGQATVHSAYKKINQKKETLPPALPKGQYDIILADPPWRYQFSETSMREIENQYPSMDLEDIKKLDIPAADNAVLFLWATAPKLEEAIQVLNAWGFVYKTCAVWDKEIIGMGYWFRGQHELLLVGVKGSFKTPDPKDRFSSVIREKRTEHSKKPEKVYSMIETMFPNAKYIELFARDTRPGWGAWGNEI
jgi:N6-adenosine-specific RNA methylase IME4